MAQLYVSPNLLGAGPNGTAWIAAVKDANGNIAVGTTLYYQTPGGILVAAPANGSGVPSTVPESNEVLLEWTTTALAASATYTGASVSVAAYVTIIGSVYSDQSGTLYVQQSPDNTNWDVSSSVAVTGGTGTGYQVTVTTPWARLEYVNGTTAQTVFRLYGWGKTS